MMSEPTKTTKSILDERERESMAVSKDHGKGIDGV
jgi:hypothetical protein